VSATVYDRTVCPEVLESLAVSEALSLAEDMHIINIGVVSDCLNVIKEVNGGCSWGQ
jgi:ribonuclease HI